MHRKLRKMIHTGRADSPASQVKISAVVEYTPLVKKRQSQKIHIINQSILCLLVQASQLSDVTKLETEKQTSTQEFYTFCFSNIQIVYNLFKTSNFKTIEEETGQQL